MVVSVLGKRCLSLAVVLIMCACGGSGGDSGNGTNVGGGGNGGGTGGGTTQAPFGLDQRTEIAGLNLATSTASGLRAVNAFPNLAAFASPTYLTHAGDGTNRLFVTQKNGLISVFANRTDVASAGTFLDLRAKVDASTDDSGLLGLTFDPDYRSNGFFYVTYVTLAPRKVRLSRFHVSANANVADAASERVVYEYDHGNDWHYGGWLGFGPDRMLYLSAGDNIFDPALQDAASPYGKVLRMRINADGSYSVPADNPWAGSLTWAMGFRNPWRCGFDRANGDLWCGDVGEDREEEINFVRRGAHYGWDYYEGALPFRTSVPPYSNFEPAVYAYDHSIGFAVIGGYVYRGSAHPSLVGRYLYTDFASSNLWAITTSGNGQFGGVSVLANNLSAPQSFGEDEAGEVYVVSSDGHVYRFDDVGGSSTSGLPATLSATGLFADTTRLAAKPGLIDYEINVPFWSDGALKQRWFALPAGTAIGFDAEQAWSFPVGTVTVKHFELAQPQGGTRRVETRVMTLGSDGWQAGTYRWRDDGSDADLVTTPASVTFTTVDPATQAPVNLSWDFMTSSQCLVCHSAAAGRVLGLKTTQVNRDHRYAVSGVTDNQLRTFDHLGLFGPSIGAASSYGALPNAYGSAPLGDRAKAYLDSNCGYCHRPGGPTPVSMDLRWATAVEAMAVVGVAPSNPAAGGSLRVAPGNHDASEMWRRMSTTSSARMPAVASHLVDKAGADLISNWIDSLR